MADSTASRTVLVTGGARRLGRAIALALARAGWRVAVHHRASAEDAAATVGACAAWTAGAFALQADLDDVRAPAALVEQCVAVWGRLDAVVNSASRFEFDDAGTLEPAGVAAHMRTNATAPVLLAQALQRHVQARLGHPAASPGTPVPAVVVNLLDQKLWNTNPDFFSYTMSKAALAEAGTMLALALAPHVRVVGVAPGLTLPSTTMSDADFAALHRLSPLGRSSTAEDVASAVVFAVETPSVTGTTFIVDGGQHLLRFERDFSRMSTAPVVTAGGPAGGADASMGPAAAVQGRAEAKPRTGQQVLELKGLRFDANLGILDHERNAPQPIQVDAELHMDVQPLLPRDDDIHHVRDYRKVRQLIIEVCTREHTNLLESLIGKLSLQLLALPGVVGVRLRVAKLAIFDDCEVAIRVESGRW